MAIASTDIQFYLTGGAGNTDPNASPGGAISSTALNLVTTLHNLFDKITGQESNAGDTEYRCLAVKNAHATLALEAAKAYIESQVAGGASIEIGVEPPARLACPGDSRPGPYVGVDRPGECCPLGGRELAHPRERLKVSGVSVARPAGGCPQRGSGLDCPGPRCPRRHPQLERGRAGLPPGAGRLACAPGGEPEPSPGLARPDRLLSKRYCKLEH